MNAKLRASLPWAIVGTLLLGCCVGVPIVGGIGWWAVSRKPQEVVLVMGKPVDKAPEKAANDPYAKWSWQEMQDHFAKQGLKTGRGPGRRGMWFAPDPDGDPIHPEQAKDMETVPGFAAHHKAFMVKDCGSPDAAKKEAAQLKDVQQRDVLVWSKFIFEGPPERRAELKKMLP